jgi:hypothetical protein
MISHVESDCEMLAQMRLASAQLPPFPNLASNISRCGTENLIRVDDVTESLKLAE